MTHERYIEPGRLRETISLLQPVRSVHGIRYIGEVYGCRGIVDDGRKGERRGVLVKAIAERRSAWRACRVVGMPLRRACRSPDDTVVVRALLAQ